MTSKWFFELTRPGAFKAWAVGPYETAGEAQAAADHAALEEGAAAGAPFEAAEDYPRTLPVATSIVSLPAGDVQVWSDGTVQELSGD